MKSFLVFLFLLSFTISCDESSQRQIDLKIYGKKPEMNLSTPDETVRSILKFSEWYDSTRSNVSKSFNDLVIESYLSFYTKETSDSLRKSIYENDDEDKNDKPKIDNVDIQSDTRAIVLVKTSGESWGIYFDKVPIIEKYILYKSKENWLVEDIEKTCFSCDGTGKERDYSGSIYNKSYEPCEHCGGDGWLSTITD